MRFVLIILLFIVPQAVFAKNANENLKVWDFELGESAKTAIGKLDILCKNVEKDSNLYAGSDCKSKYAEGLDLNITLSISKSLFFTNT